MLASLVSFAKPVDLCKAIDYWHSLGDLGDLAKQLPSCCHPDVYVRPRNQLSFLYFWTQSATQMAPGHEIACWLLW
jgi:hypothetical protein